MKITKGQLRKLIREQLENDAVVIFDVVTEEFLVSYDPDDMKWNWSTMSGREGMAQIEDSAIFNTHSVENAITHLQDAFHSYGETNIDFRVFPYSPGM